MRPRKPPRSEGGPLRLYFAARDPPLQAQCGGWDAAAAGERIEHQIARPGPLTQQRLQHRKRLVTPVRPPGPGPPVLVLARRDAPDALHTPRLQLWQRRPQEYQRRLVHAQQLLVALMLRGALRPEKLARFAMAELAGHGADWLLAEEVRPHDQRPFDVRRSLGKPFLRETAISADVSEADDGFPIDLHARALVTHLSPLAPPRQQTIGGIGEQQSGTLAREGAAVGFLDPRIAVQASHSRARTSRPASFVWRLRASSSQFMAPECSRAAPRRLHGGDRVALAGVIGFVPESSEVSHARSPIHGFRRCRAVHRLQVHRLRGSLPGGLLLRRTKLPRHPPRRMHRLPRVRAGLPDERTLPARRPSREPEGVRGPNRAAPP